MADQEEGNPKYQNPDKTQRDHRSYWLGDTFIVGSSAFGLDANLRTTYLGSGEEVIKKLEEQWKERKDGARATTSKIRGPSYLRTKGMRNIRHIAKGIRHPASRKRFPVRLSR